jgi:hypothetical protein
MGVEPAEFCFHQGLIRFIFPAFFETVEEAILGWHQRHTNSAVSAHVTQQTNTSSTSHTLPTSAATSSDMEIVENIQHQSNQPEMVQSPKVNFSQAPITPPPTPHGKKKSVSYAEILAIPVPNRADSLSSEGISGKMNLDPPPFFFTSFKNKNDIKPTKTIKKKDRTRVATNTRILTGHQPPDRTNLRELMVYNIPNTWTHEQILQALRAWGHVITIDVKVQQKYCTLKVAIVLNDPYIKLLNRGDWAISLDGMLVRWFLGA